MRGKCLAEEFIEEFIPTSYFINIRRHPYSTTEGIGIFWGVGGSVRPKNLEKCMKLNCNFQRVGGLGYGKFLELHNEILPII